ncbi:hypothetical protein NPIL_3691 [Nephila pilipes]|uniref:Uncharacterized protein n=1 Tax=Nephila pilipes TaxID=299642 RepID=A0A8X6MQS2_NEPPI|nr:hypothetical protein NPIL_3691 [Nephila pilipes]
MLKNVLCCIKFQWSQIIPNSPENTRKMSAVPGSKRHCSQSAPKCPVNSSESQSVELPNFLLRHHKSSSDEFKISNEGNDENLFISGNRCKTSPSDEGTDTELPKVTSTFSNLNNELKRKRPNVRKTREGKGTSNESSCNIKVFQNCDPRKSSPENVQSNYANKDSFPRKADQRHGLTGKEVAKDNIHASRFSYLPLYDIPEREVRIKKGVKNLILASLPDDNEDTILTKISTVFWDKEDGRKECSKATKKVREKHLMQAHKGKKESASLNSISFNSSLSRKRRHSEQAQFCEREITSSRFKKLRNEESKIIGSPPNQNQLDYRRKSHSPTVLKNSDHDYGIPVARQYNETHDRKRAWSKSVISNNGDEFHKKKKRKETKLDEVNYDDSGNADDAVDYPILSRIIKTYGKKRNPSERVISNNCGLFQEPIKESSVRMVVADLCYDSEKGDAISEYPVLSENIKTYVRKRTQSKSAISDNGDGLRKLGKNDDINLPDSNSKESIATKYDEQTHDIDESFLFEPSHRNAPTASSELPKEA